MPEGKIVIIDSEEKSSNLMKLVLVNRGYDVTAVLNGKLGVDAFGMNKFDIVYLDMSIRDIDPMYIIREFRKKDVYVVIIVLVPANSVNLVQEAFTQGVYD